MAAKKRSANTGRGSKAKKKTTTAKKGNIRTGKASPARKTNPLAREITFLAILVFGILSLLSVFHMCGVFGEVLNQLLFGLLGAPAYLFPVYLIVASGLYLSNPQKPELRRRVLFSTGLYCVSAACFSGLSTISQRMFSRSIPSAVKTRAAAVRPQGWPPPQRSP